MSAFLHQAQKDKRFYDSQIVVANTQLLCCFPTKTHPPRMNCSGVRLTIALWNCDAETAQARRITGRGSDAGDPTASAVHETEKQLRDLALAADQPPSNSIPDRHLVRAIAASRGSHYEKKQFIDKMRSEPAFQKLVIARLDEYNVKGLNGLQFAIKSLMMTETEVVGSKRSRVPFSVKLLHKFIKEGAMANLEHPDLPEGFVLRQRAAQAIQIVNLDAARQNDDR